MQKGHCGKTPQQKVDEMIDYSISEPINSNNVKIIETLGYYIKSVRSLRKKTLRDVEILAGVSNSYLSQLENDLIKKPSANVLYRLSNVLECDFNVLLKLSGIIEGQPNSSKIKPIYFDVSLTESEEKLLRDFLKYIHSKR